MYTHDVLALTMSNSALQAFLCDQGKFEATQELVKQLPATPDALICNAALGTATVESYVKEAHSQDLALLQVITTCMSSCMQCYLTLSC